MTRHRSSEQSRCHQSRPYALPYLLPAALMIAVGLCSCVHSRRLSIKETGIAIEQSDADATSRLKRDCVPAGKVALVPDADAARRLAGEQRAQVALNVLGMRGEESFSAQPWHCPAERAQILPGELVWRRNEGWLGGGRLELVRDGQKVRDLVDDGSPLLRDLVAAAPRAVEHAERAEDSLRSARSRIHWGLPFVAMAAASTAMALVAEAKGDSRLSMVGVGGGVVFVSVSLGILLSAQNPVNEATTEAMNAVDTYNDDYIRRGSQP